MIRQELKKKAREQEQAGKGPVFRLRGLDHTRIEGLSDGVFAIAIALLLISSDVPEKFSELMEFVYDFVPFAVTITLLIMIWYEHYTYFIRYGLKDGNTVAINTVLLFLILYYVYPLKFLFKTLFHLFWGLFTNDNEKLKSLFTETINISDTPTLMIIYGMGAFAIFMVLAGLYSYALNKKSQLGLSDFEIFETRSSIHTNLIAAAIPLLSVLSSVLHVGGNRYTWMVAGFIYWLYPVLLPLYMRYYNRQKKKFMPSVVQE